MPIHTLDLTVGETSLAAFPDRLDMGSMYDNLVHELIITRPESLAGWEMILTFHNDQGVCGCENRGTYDSYIVPNSLMMEERLKLQISFKQGERLIHSNIITIVIRESFKCSAPVPDPLPLPSGPPGPNEISPDTAVIGIPDGRYLGVLDGKVVGFSGGSGGTADPPYYKTFTASEWETLGANFRFMVTAIQHGKGLRPVIAEISRDASGYLEEVLVSSQKFINGDIALISNKPFDGRITII